MNSSPLWARLPVFRKTEENEIITSLQSVPIFADINEKKLEYIASLCHQRDYKEEEFIFRRGEPGAGMYIVLEGQVEILDESNGHKLAVLEEGDFFGELALLEDLPRTAAAQTTQFSRILSFFRPDLLAIMQRNPSLGNTILWNMSRLIGLRLIAANERIDRLERQLKHAKPTA